MLKKVVLLIVTCLSLTAILFMLPACGNSESNAGSDAEQKVTVSFVQQGQETIVKEIKKGGNLTINKVPTPVDNAKEGYEIEWDRKIFNNITEDIVVNAVEVPRSFIVTFESNGGEPVENGKYFYDGDYELPTPVWAGHTFKGWYDGEERIQQKGVWKFLHNPTFKAHWE